MGVEDWSTDEAQNVSLEGYDVSRGEAPDVSTSEHARIFMAKIKALSDSVDERLDNFVGENIEVDGITIENNEGTLTVVDVAIGGDTEDLLTDKIAEIEAAAETASGKAEDAETAVGQAADSATAAVAAVGDAVDAANLAAAQATQAASSAARAQAGAALADSAVQAVVAGTNLNWQKSEKAASVAIYPVPETVLEPVVTFAFTETDPAEGDKAPDNPSTIAGVTSITVTHCETEGVDSTVYTIPLGNTYYGGSIDLSTGLMTVTHRYFEVDPDVVSISCNVSYEETNTSACSFYPSPQRATPRACAWSNRFITDATIGSLMTDVEMVYAGTGATSILLRINKTRLGASYDATDKTAIEAAWKAWLRANPTYVAYQLATPYTVQLTPQQILSLAQSDKYTPRLNTIYTDASTVQVGYAKSPVRSEYELTQAIIATEGGE